MPKTRVIFFPVKTPLEKLKRLAKIASYHFQKKEHLLFQVADDKASKFIDELLWARPPSSFLPHTVSDEPSSDLILISKTKKNLNHAKYIFNLCPSPTLLGEECRVIYELEDMTAPNKLMLARSRFEAYKNEHYLIESKL